MFLIEKKWDLYVLKPARYFSIIFEQKSLVRIENYKYNGG